MDASFNFSGKVALVTGSGRGIGKGIALRLASHGADLVVNDINSKTAEETSRLIREKGRDAIAIAADVSQREQVDKMVDQAVAHFKHIDILVNNAGISLYRPILNCSDEDWNRHVDIMAKGTFLCMRKVAPLMLERKWGRIVNLGSYVAQLNCTTKFFGPYCAAKFAIIGLTQVAAVRRLASLGMGTPYPGQRDRPRRCGNRDDGTRMASGRRPARHTYRRCQRRIPQAVDPGTL